MATFKIDKHRVAAFCRSHRIRRLALFGSVLRDDFGPDSDVDILVEFEDGHVPGLATEGRALIHGYDSVEMDVLWRIIEDDLPTLVRDLSGDPGLRDSQ